MLSSAIGNTMSMGTEGIKAALFGRRILKINCMQENSVCVRELMVWNSQNNLSASFCLCSFVCMNVFPLLFCAWSSQASSQTFLHGTASVWVKLSGREAFRIRRNLSGSELPPGSALKVQPQTLLYLSKHFGQATRSTSSIAIALRFVVTTSSWGLGLTFYSIWLCLELLRIVSYHRDQESACSLVEL